jgi:hypothetical protein
VAFLDGYQLFLVAIIVTVLFLLVGIGSGKNIKNFMKKQGAGIVKHKNICWKLWKENQDYPKNG